MVQAVIFDMDGVVVDSEWLHQAMEIEALREAGLDITHDDLLEYTGMPLLDVLDGLKGEHGAEYDPRTVAERKRSNYLDRLDELDPIDGAVETVRRASAEYSTALVSSSHRRAVDAVVELLDLADAFETTISSDDVERGKPHPEPFERAADRLGASPERSVVIEDSRNGVDAALAGGFHAIGFQSADGIDLSAADHVATTMDEVAQYLERLDGADESRSSRR